MRYETILYEKDGPVLTITLERPDRLNAFTAGMRDDLLRAFDAADRDDDVRAIVVTGAGKAFCAGADLGAGPSRFDYSERPDAFNSDGSPNWSAESLRDGGGLVTLRIFECLKPVIGAVNGPAVGFGATMLLPMDIRLASERARFGFLFVRRGLVPEAASSWFLPRLVGISRAMEWVSTGRTFGADEALAGGLVRSVHAPDDLLGAARAFALEIAENAAPVAVALARQMMWRMLGADHPMAAHQIDSRGVFAQGRGPDVKEGVAAFLEKRPARFSSRVSADMPGYFPWWPERPWG
jgi:enoyl-CoA hydratase/carnithine racemase